MALRNDLSFLVGNRLVMFSEAQSTYPHNMPLRLLFYCAEVYRRILRQSKVSIYHTPNLKIPAPRFCVLCTGKAPVADTLKLSDMFETGDRWGEGMELYARVIRLGDFSSTWDAPQCLNDYTAFCRIYDSVRAASSGLDKHAVVREVKRLCLAQGVLERVLTEHGKEFDVCVSGWITREEELDFEREAARAEGRKAGLAEGRAEGREAGLVEGQQRLLKIIAEAAKHGLSTAELLKLLQSDQQKGGVNTLQLGQ